MALTIGRLFFFTKIGALDSQSIIDSAGVFLDKQNFIILTASNERGTIVEEYTGNGFGQFLKSYRKEKKMTRADLSDILDVSESYLGLLERGERKPSYTLLIKVVKTLHVSADEVIGIDSYVGRQVYISEPVSYTHLTLPTIA